MMGGFAELIQAAILVGWTAAIFWGSIMAIRGKRMWATSFLLIGSGCMLVGTLSAVGITLLSRRSYGGFDIEFTIMALGGFLALLGLVIATIGFVGVCARFGLAERRAAELEGLVGQLQQRVDSGA